MIQNITLLRFNTPKKLSGSCVVRWVDNQEFLPSRSCRVLALCAGCIIKNSCHQEAVEFLCCEAIQSRMLILKKL